MTSDEIHLIVLDLKAMIARKDDVRGFLSEDEIERAERLKAAGAADRFVLIRGLLRLRLARELGCRPEDLVFEYGESGKPRLGGAHRGFGLEFNLSHAGDVAVVALAKNRVLGVDVEKIRSVNPHLAERYFSSPESIVFRVTPDDRREEAFFHYWTAKEAFLKAKGIGIGEGLKSHSFSDPWENPPRLTWTAAADEAGRWRFHRFYALEDYIGTLAYEGDTAKILESNEL